MSGFGWDDEAKDRSWNRGSREEFERQWEHSMSIGVAMRDKETQMSIRDAARSDVYWAIDGERDYQDSKWRRPDDKVMTVGEHLVLLEEYIQRARQAWTDNVGDAAALEVIRKVAAIAVRCMELHGAPRREGF